jgi:hypothetical protein
MRAKPGKDVADTGNLPAAEKPLIHCKVVISSGAAKNVLNRFPENRYRLFAGVMGYPMNTSAPALTRASVINLEPSTNACIGQLYCCFIDFA